MKTACSDVWSGSSLILVDDPAEDVAPSYGAAADSYVRAEDRLGELQAAMRPRLVVVANVLVEY